MAQKVFKFKVAAMWPSDEETCINDRLQELGVDASNVISIVENNFAMILFFD